MKSVASLVKERVRRLNEGEIIDYDTFNIIPSQATALAKALSRLNNDGEIERLSKGVYYKPRKTVFGELKPSEDKLLKRFLGNGYVTGISAYNRMGFTSQVPSVIKIATDTRKSPINFGGLRISFVKSKDRITNKTKEVLPILDAVKDIKIILDSDLNINVQLLLNILKNLRKDQLQTLIRSALRYNPATRALVGALVERAKGLSYSKELKNSLNYLSRYNFKISSDILANKANWNIKT